MTVRRIRGVSARAFALTNWRLTLALRGERLQRRLGRLLEQDEWEQLERISFTPDLLRQRRLLRGAGVAVRKAISLTQIVGRL